MNVPFGTIKIYEKEVITNQFLKQQKDIIILSAILQTNNEVVRGKKDINSQCI